MEARNVGIGDGDRILDLPGKRAEAGAQHDADARGPGTQLRPQEGRRIVRARHAHFSFT
jgi:hypothetical protein